MRRWNTLVSVLVVACLLTVPAYAAQKARKGSKGKRPGEETQQVMVLKQWLKDIELTEEQKAKVEDLKAEFAPKLAELRKQEQSVLTPEQVEARKEAQKKARAEGKKGRELAQAVEEALKLTDEQKQQLEELRKKRTELIRQLREKLESILTEEQKAKLPKMRGGQGKRGQKTQGRKRGRKQKAAES